jgi:hypothetical protein
MGRRRLFLGLVLAALLTAGTTHGICDLVFDCGCTWGFVGAARHCNIHAPRPPHCPACRDKGTGALLAFTVFSVWAGLLRLVLRPPPS